MATSVGGIFVNVTANSSKFIKGMKKATRGVTSFSTKVASVTTKIGGLTSAVSALAAGGGLAFLTKQSFETIDSLAKTADKLSTTTEELASLRHAASLSGIEVGTMEKGLQNLIFAVQEAKRGSATYAVALENLRLDAEKLSDSSPREMLNQVADAMNALPNANVRATAAMQLFGKRALGMTKILEGGSKGLDKFRADAERLGIAVNRFDAAKIENANDSFDRLRKSIRGLVDQFAIQLAPVLEGVVERLTAIITDSGSLKTIVSAAFNEMKLGAVTFAETITMAHQAYLELLVAIEEGARKVDQGIGAFQKFRQKLGGGAIDLFVSPESVEAGLAKQEEDRQKRIEELGRKITELQSGPSLGTQLADWLQNITANFNANAKAAADAAEERRKFNKIAIPSLDDSSKKRKKNKNAQERTEQTRQQTGLFNEVFANVGTIARFGAFSGVVSIQKQELREAKKTNDNLEDIKRAFREFGNAGISFVA